MKATLLSTIVCILIVGFQPLAVSSDAIEKSERYLPNFPSSNGDI